MKKFYYAMSNYAYVELSDEECAELENLIDYNASVVEETEDPVFEIAKRNPKFAANEQRIQEILHMTDEQFDNIIIY